MYARSKGWPLQAAPARLSHQKVPAEDCRSCETANGKIDLIERKLEWQGNLREAQRRRLLETTDKCPVHKTLHSEAEIYACLRKPLNQEES